MARAQVTGQQLADLLGVSRRQISRYASEGMPYAGEGVRRRYPWPECRIWYNAQVKEQARAEAARKPAIEHMHEAERRKAAADAEIAELRLAKLRGELVPLVDVEAELRDILARVKARLRQHPHCGQHYVEIMQDLERAAPGDVPDEEAA